MLNPFIDLVSDVIAIINLALIIWIVLGLLIHFSIVNRSSPIVAGVYTTLGRLLDPMLSRIRRLIVRYLPDLGGVDISPLLLLLLLNFINNALHSWFYSI